MRNKIKFFSYHTPMLVRKNKWIELYMKIFHKKKYYRYMRILAKQRIEEREFFKMLSKQIKYESRYNIEDIKKLAEGLFDEQ